MKKTILKTVSLLLVLAMTAVFFAACKTEETPVTTSGSAEDSTASTNVTDAEVVGPTPEEIADALALNDYAQAGLELITEVLIKKYYNTRANTLAGDYGAGGSCSVWGYAAFLEALADSYALFPNEGNIREVYENALTKGMDKYRVKTTIKTPSGTHKDIVYYNATAGQKGDYYYDDNAWVCYQFLNAYVLLKDEAYLERAEELLEFFWTGWDNVLGGGIYWDKSFGGKNTCANGPISVCYLWAYQLTENEDYFDKGKQIYDWMTKVGLRASDGLYNDSVSKDKSFNTWKADYNQGTPLYAACLLYEITGEQKYLTHAEKTAKASLNLAFSSKGGKNPTVSMNGNPIYKAWCVGWLMRGFREYVRITGKAGNYFNYMELVLDKELTTKNNKGLYDPYFLTGDWGGESKTDVLQPSGVCCVFLLCAYYDVFTKPYLE
ncbi:MAG: hypothetical protein J5850_04450 [Clostridia bacterium]|nr:hypothetical protein [Clostridia bacterium]